MTAPAVIKAHGVLTLADGTTHPFTVHLPDESNPDPRIITGMSTRDPRVRELLHVSADDIAAALMAGRVTALNRIGPPRPRPPFPPLRGPFPDGAA